MTDIIQWTIVVLAVAASAVYLFRRMTRAKDGCGGCSHDCGACPLGDEFVAKCEDRLKSEEPGNNPPGPD